MVRPAGAGDRCCPVGKIRFGIDKYHRISRKIHELHSKCTCMVTVKAILEKKKKAFNSIEPEALVIDALTMLNSVNLSYLVVMEGSEYKGIFCERDYSRNVILKGRSSRDTPVKDVMTINLPIVQMNDTAEHCMMEMNRRKARYLLAYDGPHFKGVITIHDLLRQVLASKEAVFDQAVAQKLLDHDEEGSGKVF